MASGWFWHHRSPDPSDRYAAYTYAESYQCAHHRIVDLLKDKDPNAAVPATPGWTATDVVRHFTGLAVDLTNSVLEGYASDEWTAAQVDARADHDLDAVLGEWASVLDEASALLDDVDSLGLDVGVRSVAGVFSPKGHSAHGDR